MQISSNTIQKMNSLSEENQKIIISLVDQLSMTPLDVLSKLREQGLNNRIKKNKEGLCNKGLLCLSYFLQGNRNTLFGQIYRNRVLRLPCKIPQLA